MVKDSIIGFILHKRAYQNNSELVDILTDEYGKIRVIAKWSKNSKTPLQSHTRLRIILTGTGELKRLQTYEIHDYFREYNGEMLLLLSYVNELIMKLVSNGPISLCKIYYYVLEHLSNDAMHNQYILRLFESTLLAELGYGIDFTADHQGQAISSKQYYLYIQGDGFIPSEQGVKGADILCYAKEKIPSPEGIKYYKELNKLRLQQLLGSTILESRKLYKAFKAHNL